ncbi:MULTISPECIES: BafA family autotransporter [unclassified Bartonella]|uniref:BafA family autotransporter n=1 Tax=unclassified Bartonella TaxID=2645622 RepID=UPI00099A54E9|nr:MULTISPECIES: BafA family autotransporter [unclassified Bartonella]AQX27827.1 outer membrane autotransporter barrel domain-containing protein [Bartonella sp. JB15]AQX29108.1 outer membrane autotransporter barrel domain-containing protein [Bartonella sp. JB63]
MQCKLVFGILVANISLVQATSADSSPSDIEVEVILPFNSKNSLRTENFPTYFDVNSVYVDGHIVSDIILHDGSSYNEGDSFYLQNDSLTVNENQRQKVQRGQTAFNVNINGGEQFVFGMLDDEKIINSHAYNTVIYSQDETPGQQNLYEGGVAWNTKVMKGGVQNIYKGNNEEGGFAVDTEVFKDGKQRVFAGGTAITVILQGNAVQEIYPDGYVYDLTVNDNASSWVYAGAVLEGNTIINDSGKFYLYAGSAERKSTIESFVLNGKDTELLVISARDADSALIKKLSGKGTVTFTLDQVQARYSRLYVENLSDELGSLHFKFNTAIAEKRGDYLVIDNGNGNHTISVVDSGSEIANPLSQQLDLITDKSESGGAHFNLVDFSGANIKAVDGGTYMYGLKQRKDNSEKIWYLAADRTDEVDPLVPTPMPIPTPPTTPSTDAVLSLAVVPELVFNNELQSLRAGRGILGKNKKNNALWTYAIKGQERLATGHAHFTLDQTGIILGVDRLKELMNGDFYVGGFGSYDQARIAHARGGVSNMDTYSVGAYATYFDNQGWYLDSVLKYNYYKNNLKTISTSGLDIKGDYNQWALGTSFEAGYHFEAAQDTWIQPYTQLIGIHVKGEEIRLSNKMTGDMKRSTSVRSAVGLSIGHKFNLNSDTHLMTYITAAWLREYIDNNSTTINKQHKFTTDLSGDTGKLGIGLNSFVGENLSLYAETYYLKGQKVKQSLQGILGLRYSF